MEGAWWARVEDGGGVLLMSAASRGYFRDPGFRYSPTALGAL